MTVTEWLKSFNHVTCVREVKVVIKGVEYSGATYHSLSDAGNAMRLYLLGDLPKSYRKSSKTAFVINGEDWYVTSYREEPISDEYKPYHPFGKNFQLCRWPPIDHYHYWRGEKKSSYHRIPAYVT